MKRESSKLKLFAVCILLLTAVICIQPVSADSLENANVPIFTIPEKTIMYDGKACPEKVALSTYTQSSLNIPEFIIESSNAKKASNEIRHDEEIYSLVTFNNPIPIRSDTVEFDITLYGEEYTVNLERMPENIDDGIDSYLGTVEGIENSEVIFTVNDKNLLIGSISYPGEYLTITSLDTNVETRISQNPLHIVYSEYDILQPSEPVDICGMLEPTVSEILASESLMNLDDTSRATNSLVTVDVLVVTDNAFFTLEDNWVTKAQSYIAAANSATSFGREDVGVFLNVISYDSSKRIEMSTHDTVLTNPLSTLMSIYPRSYLDSVNADICLYLGGHDRSTGTSQGQAYNFGDRYAWSQMVADASIGAYNGGDHARKYCIIHEVGHCFNGRHEQGYAKWFSGSLVSNTVMIGEYYGSLFNLLEFSSTASPSYLGDATHDNAKMIRNYKATASQHT